MRNNDKRYLRVGVINLNYFNSITSNIIMSSDLLPYMLNLDLSKLYIEPNLVVVRYLFQNRKYHSKL